MRPRSHLRERVTGGELALVADSPDLLSLPVVGDQQAQRLGTVPPAELRAGDDPGVLEEEVADPRVRGFWMGLEPGSKELGALRERHLLERLFWRVREDE